ncbi:N-acetylmuramoyl-L-alanine amidase [Streptomyces fradiae]|uniref:N-acetylmuramoyl-L-alanine amidase n=1 Tax=Streptomyces fradiae TaxID=1906 RepID=UPI0033CCA60F
MRSIRVPLIGVAVAVATASGSALALPLPLSATAVAAPRAGAAPDPGSTRSLPLVPLAGHERSAAPGTRAAQGLPRRDVEPFSMVGVVWEDPGAELHGTVQVRTRSAATGAWSAWQDLDTHQHEHAADPGAAEARSTAVRGGTAPLWVGDSDGVEVRVRPEEPGERGAAPPALPRGLRVELVDPGDAPSAAPGDTPSAAPGDAAPAEGRADADPQDDTPHDDTASGAGDGADSGTEPAPDTGTDTDPGAEADTGTDTDPGAEAPADEEGAQAPTDPTAADPTAPRPSAAAAPGSDAPGSDAPTGPLTPEESAASAANAGLAALGALEIAELTKEETEASLAAMAADGGTGTDTGTDTGTATDGGTGTGGGPGGGTASGPDAGAGAEAPAPVAAKTYIGPRPGIVTRKGWGADEKLREPNFLYTTSVHAAFVHHSATGNNYTCAQAPSVLRGIYRYHVQSMGWRDIGYNFAVDKCGKIYEGRAGGVARAVQGAHTLGFNSNTTGIAVLGSFATTTPPAAAVTGVAKLTAWKLGLHARNPLGKSTLTSAGGNKYAKGTKVQLNTVSGHRDGYSTACPGAKLYAKLGTVRSTAAGLQGRP